MKPSRSMIGQLQRIPGAAVFTFDYHNHSARWVDDPHIGPALGESIDCLFKATGEKAIVVAHSMGGLATRYALSTGDRAKKVSTVITFGTPNTGSLFALLGDGALAIGAAVNKQLAVLRMILAVCGKLATGKLDTGTPCDILPAPMRALDSEAGRALRAGSRQLDELKPFPAGVKVDALAGDAVFTTLRLGWFHLRWDGRIPLGDLIVTSDSAVDGASQTKKASCAYQLNPIRGGTDLIGLSLGLTAKNDVAQPITSVAGACYHSNLMRTVELTNEATGMVNEDIESRQPATKVVNVVAVDKNGNPAKGYTVTDDGWTVDCSPPQPYPSPSSVGRNIVQCGAHADAADVCWTKPDRVTLLCGGDPWVKTLTVYRASREVPAVPAAKDPEPWGLELDNGLKCRIRDGGAWSGRSDNLVGAYHCAPGTDVVLVAQKQGAETIDKSTRAWTVLIGVLDDKSTGSPPPTKVMVRTAYFAGSP
ncbi:triacylglycerol lipase [Kibdelosporangium aridum]|nr:hypothetical protein [Kibdelosporangium aridum]